MFPGIVESADGEWLYLYMWGTAATHHVQGHCPDMWGNKCVHIDSLVPKRAQAWCCV